VRRLLLIGSAVAAALAGASLAFPHAMLSPGDVSEGHAGIEADCLACHAPFQGPDERCAKCHEVEAIESPGRPRFHGALLERECSACHTDHEGRAAPRAIREFRHDLLREDMRGECAGCHVPPADGNHMGVRGECAACHRTEGWKPSTFDHAKSFRFDRNHPADCATCHPAGLEEYTCYGCHEHEPLEMERKHAEEGIKDFEACAECHRSGDEHELEGGPWEEDGGGRRRRGRDKDD
jgi:hypothetical protein